MPSGARPLRGAAADNGGSGGEHVADAAVPVEALAGVAGMEPVGDLLGVLLARRAATHRVGYDRRQRVARQM